MVAMGSVDHDHVDLLVRSDGRQSGSGLDFSWRQLETPVTD